MKTSDKVVGIIVGRFQVPELHDAHKKLIEYVMNNHERVHILLGVSPHPSSYTDPLPFEVRRQMIEDQYPNIRCYPIKDTERDEMWVKNLDFMISTLESTNSIMLYGGRDSFISTYTKYHHKYETTELIPDEYVKIYSGTQLRDDVAKKLYSSLDFRRGIIWTNYNKYPTVYSTVDAFIMNSDKTKVLLCKKNESDPLWRFVGGFADTNSDTFEKDVIREVKEETNMDVVELDYVGNYKIDDWRYNNQHDCIRTMFYVVCAVGNPYPDDDIVSVKWFDIEEVLDCDINNVIPMPQHKYLVDRFAIKLYTILNPDSFR